MVCANKDAYYVRQFDATRKKLRRSIVSSMYETALERELQGTAKLLVDALGQETDGDEETFDRHISRD
jgi:hypothetical protein